MTVRRLQPAWRCSRNEHSGKPGAVHPKAVEKARAALKAANRDASRLNGYVWHSNRHTFASRLAMAGVDLLTLKEVGGWKTMTMVQRYAHLSPGHLHEAVERLVNQNPTESRVELARIGLSPSLKWPQHPAVLAARTRLRGSDTVRGQRRALAGRAGRRASRGTETCAG